MKKTSEKKMFDELFVEDVQLETEAQNVESHFMLDWDYYEGENSLILSSKKEVDKNNFVDYVDWFVGSAFGLGRSRLNDKLEELFDESWGGHYDHRDQRDELVEAIIKNVERKLYWEDVDYNSYIKELAAAWNYSLVHYRLGQSWAYEYGSHSEVEVVSELWGTGIKEDGDVHELLDSVDKYDPSLDEDEFVERGREALESFLDELDEGEELEWESVMEDGWTNPFHVSTALEKDEELFMRVYNRLDEEGRETFKSDYLKRVVDLSTEL